MTSHWHDFLWTPVHWRATRSSCWMQIEYRQSLAAPLLRPVIRFTRPGRTDYAFAQAPLFGQGRWLGHVPKGTTEIHIAHGPESELGLDLVSARRVYLASLLPRALRNKRKVAFEAIGAALIRADSEHAQALGFARGGVPLTSYDAWRHAMIRAPEPTGIDKPLIENAARGPTIGTLAPHHSTPSQLASLIAQLETQPGASWLVFADYHAKCQCTSQTRSYFYLQSESYLYQSSGHLYAD